MFLNLAIYNMLIAIKTYVCDMYEMACYELSC